MKVRTSRIHPEPKPTFHPFRLEFIIETREEADQFYNLFNFAPVCRLLKTHTNIAGEDVRKAIEHAVPRIVIENWGRFLDFFRGH